MNLALFPLIPEASTFYFLFFDLCNVRRRLPRQYAPGQAMSTVEDIASPNARRRCHRHDIAPQSRPAAVRQPRPAGPCLVRPHPGHSRLAGHSRPRLPGEGDVVTSPSSSRKGDVLDRGHRLSRGVLMGESASHNVRCPTPVAASSSRLSGSLADGVCHFCSAVVLCCALCLSSACSAQLLLSLSFFCFNVSRERRCGAIAGGGKLLRSC